MNPGGWDSLLVEILRFGGETGVIRRGDQYLIVAGAGATRKHDIEIELDDVLECVDDLRYVDRRPNDAATDKVRVEVTRMLGIVPPERPRQIDLVVNFRELATLPFELVAGPDGKALLVDRNPPTVLTRRVRGAFREHTPRWPARPNILLVASDAGGAIPLDEHKSALRRAVLPWIEPLAAYAEPVPHEDKLFSKADGQPLAEVARLCRDADPAFTHVHVLAHGCSLGEGYRSQWGLAFSDGEGGTECVSAECLADALTGGRELPTVVTITACDSGNLGSPAIAVSSPAHAIHTAGVPVVLASQFPMTASGSVGLVEEFYSKVFAGDDVRDALVSTRQMLYERREQTWHDWLSLVAYVQLPEGYQDRLLDVRLATDLAALRSAQAWADHLVEHDAPPTVYGQVASRIRQRITSLATRADQARTEGRKDMLRESRGLLASAHKRLAELLFWQSRSAPAAGAQSREALEKAERWYTVAYAEDPSAHWLGAQAIALEVVTTGTVSEPGRWHAAMYAASAPTEDRIEAMWQHASRAELYLLARYAGQPRQVDAAAQALQQFIEQVAVDEPFPVESTARQLRRYLSWWTSEHGFFEEAEDLRADVVEVYPAGWRQ